MNKKQIKEMYVEKMDFGSHGVYHYRWQLLKKKEQENEIINSRRFFENLGFNTENFSVCFPYFTLQLPYIYLTLHCILH